MLVNILNICSDDELFCQDDDMSDLADALKGTMTEEQINEYRQKKQAEKAKLQKKILGIGRMARHFQQMREDAEKSEFSNFASKTNETLFRRTTQRSGLVNLSGWGQGCRRSLIPNEL